ncbi:hypothetical protein SAMN05421741_11860 [Paenimyroides ummariense]|uniref:HEPN AbiJ-N-terminal domain-containing protein n=1 Tax=Paenimyroides ummariense TaxID=913024 RepID=A0A1I5E398_9FLAO|nr:hypothetical protein [Paenimyroides ummariense]SFO05631.1 hypothetical protein SAMN05421741_11860 [Paenimyroides ummariense]
MKFSERMGFKEPRNTIQTESVDLELKNELWNVLYLQYLDEPKKNYQFLDECRLEHYKLFTLLWLYYFKNKIDNQSINIEHNIQNINSHLYSKFDRWYYIYDIIEFIFANFEIPDEFDNLEHRKYTTELLNDALESNLSGYRFINGLFSPITNEQEIEAIEEAVINTDEYNTVSSHLNKALELLSDKKAPDFSNSIKESISAIESYFKVFFKDPNISFGNSLNNLEHNHGLDKQIKESILRIYGYSNNTGAIRHGLKPGDTTDKIKLAEAKYMLVTCSAFINYLKETNAN